MQFSFNYLNFKENISLFDSYQKFLYDKNLVKLLTFWKKKSDYWKCNEPQTEHQMKISIDIRSQIIILMNFLTHSVNLLTRIPVKIQEWLTFKLTIYNKLTGYSN